MANQTQTLTWLALPLLGASIGVDICLEASSESDARLRHLTCKSPCPSNRFELVACKCNLVKVAQVVIVVGQSREKWLATDHQQAVKVVNSCCCCCQCRCLYCMLAWGWLSKRVKQLFAACNWHRLPSNLWWLLVCRSRCLERQLAFLVVFSRFNLTGKQTNKQTDRHTDKQADDG